MGDMSEAETMENIRLHERVGNLEQEVHTLKHRAEDMEWLRPKVTEHGTIISEMVANQRAMEQTVKRLSDGLESLDDKLDRVNGGQQDLRTTLKSHTKAIVVVGAILSIVLAMSKIAEMNNAWSHTKAVQGEYVPGHYDGTEWLLSEASVLGFGLDGAGSREQLPAWLWRSLEADPFTDHAQGQGTVSALLGQGSSDAGSGRGPHRPES